MTRTSLLTAMLGVTASVAAAQDHTPDRDAITKTLVKEEYSPYVGREFPTQVLWGETHLHTSVSVDAGTMCTVGQEDAFRFARGEEITTTHGLRARLSRPLDVENATWTNSIGSPELIAVWEDPAFDPDQSAFYYARVIEIPTPRWTAYEAKRFAIDMPDEVPMFTQERAYTSPIWYAPED